MLNSLLNSTDIYMYNNHQRILINEQYFEEIIIVTMYYYYYNINIITNYKEKKLNADLSITDQWTQLTRTRLHIQLCEQAKQSLRIWLKFNCMNNVSYKNLN